MGPGGCTSYTKDRESSTQLVQPRRCAPIVVVLVDFGIQGGGRASFDAAAAAGGRLEAELRHRRPRTLHTHIVKMNISKLHAAQTRRHIVKIC